MSSPARERAALSRQQAITDVEGRIRLITTLADALAQDGTQPGKVLQAQEWILELRGELQRLRGR